MGSKRNKKRRVKRAQQKEQTPVKSAEQENQGVDPGSQNGQQPPAGDPPEIERPRMESMDSSPETDCSSPPTITTPLALPSSSASSSLTTSSSKSQSEDTLPLNQTSKMTTASPERRTIHMSHYGGSLKNKIDQGDQVFKAVEDFVAAFVEEPAKRRPIKRVLVATNGIAAVRCILSIRKLLMQLFRDDKMIKFICLTTQHEIASNAEYLKLADYIVFSPGGDNRNNYANVNEIVSHAVEQRVDAVWAGWGHASENPELPRQLAARDIVFIGPPSNAMFSLGDKIASTIIAQTLDIPTIEWSGNGLKLDLDNCTPEGGHITVSQELFNKATVKDLAEGLRALEEHKIGYPLMIKASEGGGGKGIRKCKNEADFRENFQQVLTEVPGSPIFLMKCVENARHIEVQLIADRYETVIPVFTRDCSIQRRCQKIIEEAPASIAPEETLSRMQKDAVKIAKLVGYESAGTVEYMYLPDENKYYFLELNPRLQVEHPCTEMLANINIPAIQMQIAMGLPLHRITDIRLFYGLDRYDNTPLPDELVLTKTEYAVIAARITSEDPEDFFRPSTGSVEVLNFRSAQNVWGYFSVSSAGKVHEFADSQFGHLFARGRTRHEAISVMLCALQELELRATFASQVSYLVDMLKEPDFTQNRFNTQWLDNRIANKVLQKSPLPMHEIIAISSAVIGHSKIAGAFNNFKNAIERGQILPTKDLTETFLFDLVKDMSIYKVTVTRSGPLLYIVSMNGAKTQIEIRLLGDGSLLCAHRERIYTCNLEETTDKFKVTIGRSIVVFEKDNDPTILKSPYTGKLLGYKKANKEWVGVGAIYASVESMKLVFNVEVKKAPGRLEYVAKEGDLLYPGSVIARLVDQKDSEKYRPRPFLDAFPEWIDDVDDSQKLTETKLYNLCYDKCINILKGSIPPGVEEKMPTLVDELFRHLESRTLPDLLLKAAVNPVINRLPPRYAQALKDISDGESMNKFGQINHLIEDYFQTIRPNEFDTARAVTEPIISVCEKFKNGTLSNSCHVVNALLTEYKDCEKFFEGRVYDDAVAMLIETYPNDKDQVVSLIYSHTQLKGKNKFMKEILTAVARRGMHLVGPLEENLREVGNMFHTEDICELARQLLLQNCRFKYRKFLNKIIWDLDGVAVDKRELMAVLPVDEAISTIRAKLVQMVNDGKTLQQIAESSPWISKVLHEFFFDPELSSMAIRSYVSQRFGTESVSSETINFEGAEAESFDFSIEKCTKMQHLTPWESKNQFFSIVKIQLPSEQLSQTICNEDLVKKLAEKYNKAGVKSNGVRPTLNLMMLVGVNKTGQNKAKHTDYEERVAQLEELPSHSNDDDLHLKEAERCMEEMKNQLSAHMPAVNINAKILVCQPHKPLVQLDLVGTEILELWRLPTEAQLVSDRLCSLQVFKFDDADKRYSRLFVREIIEMTTRDEEKCEEELLQMIHSQLDNACGAINVSMRKFKKNIYVSNHILLHVSFRKLSADFTFRYADLLDEIFEHAIKEQRDILYKHHVTEVEIVYTKLGQQQQLVKRRVKFLDETGVTPEFGIYDEYKKRIVPQKLSHQLYGETLESHTKIKKIEKKRAQTRINGTTYVYDFPTLFGRACLEEWRKLKEKTTYGEGSAIQQKSNLFDEQFAQLTAEQRAAFLAGDYRKFFNEIELIVKDNELKQLSDKEELRRRADNCNNETGVVAWILRMFTPEKPTGYDTVVIANDITYQSGSFAMPEDLVYSLASEFARKQKIPRINVSSNSGARIGLADDVSKVFRAKFKNPEKPDDGFDYLYVDSNEESTLKDQIVYERMPNGQLKLKAVVGKENENIGVENLQGSGLIAGETSAAYDEVPTYCFVTGRTVGIGAYTARLAHRVVQARASHLILTGAPALNTLLGKEVYTSNNQLGGIQIMYKNGVTHAVVDDDFEGICKIVQWMSYLPTETASFPYRKYLGLDSASRAVTFPVEPNKPYDVRGLIDSRDSREFQGICDANSFDEIMNDWAKTIIAGRARLGGIPIGVVSSELRNVCTINPADPASPNSQSVEVHQAGQVWYPDSAFKTAEVIGDFNREGLPLLFIASLRGFSGGQRDMFEMVLKFGAQIVDALRKYRMPVIIYIPTYGELRGGAWVVLDSKINPGFIHMVADKESRGGILEPNAIVGIKFRGDKLLALQKRNDEAMRRIDEELTAEIKTNGATSERAIALNKMLLKRSDELKKAYRGVTEEFADLHDRAERMQQKRAIQHVTDLENSRNLFIEIFTVESAKILLSEKYLARADRSVTQQEAYKWVVDQFNEFHPDVCDLPPAEQIPVLKKFVDSGTFKELINRVKAESVARELCSMNDEELARIREILQKRKFSL